jgi:1-acyl-sn-glycerol-3-phosphate acyltransferase
MTKHQLPTDEDPQITAFRRYLVGIWLWSVFAVLTLIVFTGIFINRIWDILRRAKNSENATHYLAGVWSRLIFSLVPGWRLTIKGLDNLPSQNDAPVVIVCNHESLTDIWAIYFLPLQFRWLSKDAVFKVPLIGAAMRWAGYIAIKRGDSRSHSQALSHCAEVLRSGCSVLFFPEGTRSVTNELREFKVGAFKLALDEKVKILPLAITGTRSLLKKGTMLPGIASVRISVMPLYELDATKSIEENAADARLMIGAEIKRLRAIQNGDPSFQRDAAFNPLP